ncbi:MAG: hypothetical protein H6Q13_1343 [Bacteroidetes bacterium]|nr:hypothetical protein [Bacteroidota bacterium]
MELKLNSPDFSKRPIRPLIVPYGIETLEFEAYANAIKTPLIVPYGIET